MTRYEQIMRGLTIEKMLKYLYDYDENYCKTICKMKSGNEYTCPYDAKDLEQCKKCAIDYLMMEVDE